MFVAVRHKFVCNVFHARRHVCVQREAERQELDRERKEKVAGTQAMATGAKKVAAA
jgi:hypothetical protein